MKSVLKKKRGLILLLFFLLYNGLAWGGDPGNPDTAYIECGFLGIDDTGGTVIIKVKFYTDNVGDTNKLSGFSLPLSITNSNPSATPVLDTTVSATYSGSAVSSFNITKTHVPTNGGDPSIFPLQFVLGAASFGSGIGAGRYLYANIKLHLEDTTTICIDTLSTQTASLSFVKITSDKYTPQWKSACCKVSFGFPAGDASCNGVVNLTDVIYLVNYLFKGGPAPCALKYGDSNCDTKVNLSDVIYDVNYLFKGGPKPKSCP